MNKVQKLIKAIYLNREGQPFEATVGQAQIFEAIALRDDLKRVFIKTCTQYGKSETASQSVLYLAIESKKRIVIVAPSLDQGRIIMGGVIDHIFDNEYAETLVDFEGNKDRFKRERSKTRIDFRNAGSIMVITANASGIAKEGKGLMGFGADVVIVEESSLIPDPMFAKILRMVGGVKNGKLVQLGNPWERNHFYRAWMSDNYYKISIDYQQALKEGRYTQEFINEAKATIDPIDWQVFYECNFPDSVSDALIPLSKIEEAVEREMPLGIKSFGGDVARFGSDKTVAVVRAGSKVIRIEKWDNMDTMKVVGSFRHVIDTEKPEGINVDVVGIGAGVVDRLREERYDVNGVNVGGKPSDTEKFANIRSEIFWGLRNRFVNDDISIPNDRELIHQLSEIRYNYNSRGQVVIESKESMKKRGIKSPDIADALALAFMPNIEGSKISYSFG